MTFSKEDIQMTEKVYEIMLSIKTVKGYHK